VFGEEVVDQPLRNAEGGLGLQSMKCNAQVDEFDLSALREDSEGGQRAKAFGLGDPGASALVNEEVVGPQFFGKANRFDLAGVKPQTGSHAGRLLEADPLGWVLGPPAHGVWSLCVLEFLMHGRWDDHFAVDFRQQVDRVHECQVV